MFIRFFYAILYTIRYNLTEKSYPCENDNELKDNIKLMEFLNFFY